MESYLSIRRNFASATNVGKVLDDFLRVLSLAGSGFSAVDERGNGEIHQDCNIEKNT